MPSAPPGQWQDKYDVAMMLGNGSARSTKIAGDPTITLQSLKNLLRHGPDDDKDSNSGSEEEEEEEDEFVCGECGMPGEAFAPNEEVCRACAVY